MVQRRGRGRGRGRIGGRGGGFRGRGRGSGVGKFLAPHTGRQAGAIANAQAGAEYNPEIRELRSQAKGSRKREADLGQWYAQLAQDYQGATDAGAAALQSIQDTTGKQLAEASGRSSADLAALSAQDEAFAKLVGGPKDTTGLSQIAQAGAAAERSRVALGTPIAQEQANFVGRLGGNKVAARMQGIEERRAEQRRRDKLKADLTAVRKDKGRARVGKKEEIREADRSYSTDLKQMRQAKREARAAEQQAAADAALARVEAARQAQSDAVSAQQAQERIGISRRNARTSERSQRISAKGGLTPSERRDQREGSRSAKIEATNLYKAAKKPPKTDADWAAFAHLVAEQSEISPAEAQRAVNAVRKAVKQKRKNRAGYTRRRAQKVVGTVIPGEQITK